MLGEKEQEKISLSKNQKFYFSFILSQDLPWNEVMVMLRWKLWSRELPDGTTKNKVEKKLGEEL